MTPLPKRKSTSDGVTAGVPHDALKARNGVNCPKLWRTTLTASRLPHCGYYQGREVLIISKE